MNNKILMAGVGVILIAIGAGSIYYVYKNNPLTKATAPSIQTAQGTITRANGVMGNSSLTTVSGTITSVNTNSLVLSTTDGDKTITLSSNIRGTIETSVAKADILKVGDTVSVQYAQNNDGTATATTISTVTIPTRPSGTPPQSSDDTNRPPNGQYQQGMPRGNGENGRNGNFGIMNRTIGKITAVTDTSVTVTTMFPTQGTVTYVLNGTTAYTTSATAALTDLTTGAKVNIETIDQNGTLIARGFVVKK